MAPIFRGASLSDDTDALLTLVLSLVLSGFIVLTVCLCCKKNTEESVNFKNEARPLLKI